MSVFKQGSRRRAGPRGRVRLLLAAVAAAVGVVGCASRTLSDIDPSLIGLWHFDEAAGSTIAIDSSGNGNHGTLQGLDAASVWVTTGRFGNALAVEGAGYVLVQDSATINRIVSQVTVSAWIYLEGTINDYGTALSRQIGTSINQYYHLSVYQPDGLPNLFINPTTGVIAMPRDPVPVSKEVWTHLAGTYDGVTAILYVNGEPAMWAAVAAPFDTDITPLILGGNGNGKMVSEFFPGRIDEVALWDRALTPDEIRRLAAFAAF